MRGERPRHSDPLPLAARELVREEEALLGTKADLGEQLGHSIVALGRGAHLHQVERLADHVARAGAWIQRAVGVLEDDLEVAAGVAQGVAFEIAQHGVSEPDALRP